MGVKVQQLQQFCDFGGLATVNPPKGTLLTGVTPTVKKVTLPPNTAFYALGVSFSLSDVVAMALYTDAPAIVATNSTEESQDVIFMPVKEPLIWHYKMPASMRFFSGNISNIYVSTSDKKANFVFAVALD